MPTQIIQSGLEAILNVAEDVLNKKWKIDDGYIWSRGNQSKVHTARISGFKQYGYRGMKFIYNHRKGSVEIELYENYGVIKFYNRGYNKRGQLVDEIPIKDNAIYIIGHKNNYNENLIGEIITNKIRVIEIDNSNHIIREIKTNAKYHEKDFPKINLIITRKGSEYKIYPNEKTSNALVGGYI